MSDQKHTSTRRNWYAANCGHDSHQQAMIADEDDPTGRTIAVVYDRKDAPFIIRACNEHERLADALNYAVSVIDSMDDRMIVRLQDDILDEAIEWDRLLISERTNTPS